MSLCLSLFSWWLLRPAVAPELLPPTAFSSPEQYVRAVVEQHFGEQAKQTPFSLELELATYDMDGILATLQNQIGGTIEEEPSDFRRRVRLKNTQMGELLFFRRGPFSGTQALDAWRFGSLTDSQSAEARRKAVASFRDPKSAFEWDVRLPYVTWKDESVLRTVLQAFSTSSVCGIHQDKDSSRPRQIYFRVTANVEVNADKPGVLRNLLLLNEQYLPLIQDGFIQPHPRHWKNRAELTRRLLAALKDKPGATYEEVYKAIETPDYSHHRAGTGDILTFFGAKTRYPRDFVTFQILASEGNVEADITQFLQFALGFTEQSEKAGNLWKPY